MEEKGQLFLLLKFIDESDKPVGSGTACVALCNANHQVSEATAGRLLRELDERGFTERQGFKGRVLTNEGREYLHKLTHENNRMIFSQELARIVKSRNRDELLDILVARKAIEREIARLAALKITDEQLEQMESTVSGHLNTENNVEVGDVSFHNALADAAGNRVLKAALDLIRQDAQLSPILGYIRKQVHSKIFSDHLKIYQAVASRNPYAAEQAMVEHIENIMADVQKFWSQYHDELELDQL
jgi:GntR family transcriptional regulator, transcriptional repressor for pyruvate dehydrogenase complex